MKRASIGTALIAMMAIGCSDSTAPGTSDLVGTWMASSYVFTNTDSTAQTVDIIALDMGFTITFTETSLSGTFTIPDLPAEEFTATYTLNGDQITVTDPQEEGPETLTISVDGNTMTLSGTDTFDFNDDGLETPASYVITLVRQQPAL